MLATGLCKPSGWHLEPHLVAIVNARNVNRDGVSHGREFTEFKRQLRRPAWQTRLMAWQNIAQAIAQTQEPNVLLLLGHLVELSYLNEG